MAPLTPLVLEGISLLDFVQYVLDTHTRASTLIVCSAKDTFLRQLQDALSKPLPEQHDDEDNTNEEVERNVQRRIWSIPTLRLLASSRTVKMVFCPDVTHLRAYLATHAYRTTMQSDVDSVTTSASSSTRLLAILNPISLHTPTSAFSAQGLNRLLAIAVEAAHHSKSRLILAECPTEDTNLPSEDPVNFDEELAPPQPPPASPWDEDLSILNVTTKSFGAGERGWVGRTVKIRSIAERWCTFQSMSAAED